MKDFECAVNHNRAQGIRFIALTRLIDLCSSRSAYPPIARMDQKAALPYGTLLNKRAGKSNSQGAELNERPEA